MEINNINEIKLRPYQEECVNMINALPDGSKKIISIATGLGKTIIFTSIERKGKTLILSHRDELVRQPLKYFPQTVKYGIEKASEHSSSDDEVVSASVQTISSDKRLNNFSPNEFDTIIVDEAHHAAAPTYRKVINYFKPRILLGFTATPKRGDKVRLDDIFDDILYEKNILWGIQNNYLCNLRCFAIDAKVSLKGVKFTAGDYNMKELAQAVETPDVFKTICKAYGEYIYGTNHHVLLYCLTKEGCFEIKKAISEKYPDEENKIAVITSDTPQDERDLYEKDYMNPEGTIRCLINCMILTEGTDLPITDVLIIARPTANSSLYTQIVGRGTRLYEGKKECLILDIMPKSQHKLCSMSSLVGIDWDKLKKKQKLALEEGIDLISFAKQVEEEKNKFNQKITLIATKIELFEEKLKEETQEIINSIKYGVSNYSKQINENKNQQILDAIEEDGEIDSKGMLYEIGLSDDERYVINGDYNDACKICIAKPDMLGNSYITAYINGDIYKSKEMKINDAFAKAQQMLTSKYSNKDYLWDKKANKRLQEEPASDKQLGYIYGILSSKGYSFDARTIYNGEMSKYNASIMIEKLNHEKKLKNSIKELKSNIHTIEETKDKDEEQNSEPKYLSFDSLCNNTKSNQIKKAFKNEVETFKVNENEYIKYSISNIVWGALEGDTSEKQVTYCCNLIEKLEEFVEFDMDIFNYVYLTPKPVNVGRLITMFKYLLNNLSKEKKYIYYVSKTLEMAEQNTKKIREKYPEIIGYKQRIDKEYNLEERLIALLKIK